MANIHLDITYKDNFIILANEITSYCYVTIDELKNSPNNRYINIATGYFNLDETAWEEIKSWCNDNLSQFSVSFNDKINDVAVDDYLIIDKIIVSVNNEADLMLFKLKWGDQVC